MLIVVILALMLNLTVIVKSVMKDKFERAVLFLSQMIIIIFAYIIYLKTF